MSREKPKLAITRATAPRLSGDRVWWRTTVKFTAALMPPSLAFRVRPASVYSRVMRRWVASLLLSLVTLTGCGVGGAPVRASLSARQALTSPPELLEFETSTTRLELYREVARISEVEAGQAAQAPVLFPISQRGELVAAPGFEART